MNLLFTVHFVIVLLFVFNFCLCRCCHRLLPFLGTVVLLHFQVDSHTWVLDRRWHNASNATYFRFRGVFISELEE
ncbi:hypothetical protein HanRHA438_Chr14g0669451 [Helianthus annuus]|uniref:Uncharacterized protein n=1 Tax=Helianthus annuus TaxID=4232 RepID=A0A9K3H8T8_HELAN|nr:hypothetical protein HanXRQr2_Chr14g0658471 [Helianthus annuus]KAJ0465276.1 hypothetical protein HanHA300_Chr14g0536501 [Helianthus annuus]KAJ0470042.1 hypothetical protein HanIR_Chr14g0714491 [Helianthus annuus]KAJ0486868.1 hypothetical protein HanHA89_Chr14g0584291 [Helianthus annuus]KAJ0661001.1 hypothetical protein HanOQP8_Chr14g0543861 [Helianthus annuus]